MKNIIKTSLLAAILCIPAAGCGGDDDGVAPTPDAGPDAATVPDAANATCKMAPSYPGATVPNSIEAQHNSGTTESVVLGVALNADQDGFTLELYKLGIFANGFTPGTYPISGPELNYETCALCVRGFGDSVDMTNPGDSYFATGGSVVITEVGAAGTGNLKATLKDIVFEHVTINSTTFHSTPVGDGCVSGFSSDVTIDSPIVEAPTGPKRATPPFGQLLRASHK